MPGWMERLASPRSPGACQPCSAVQLIVYMWLVNASPCPGLVIGVTAGSSSTRAMVVSLAVGRSGEWSEEVGVAPGEPPVRADREEVGEPEVHRVAVAQHAVEL